MVNVFRFDIRFFLLPGKVVESKRNPLSFRFLVLATSVPVPEDKVAESYEMADISDFDDDDNDDDEDPNDDDDARTRIIRG